MRRTIWSKRTFWTCLGGLLCAISLVGSLQPQHTPGSALEVTTQERLESEAWWPTMSTAPLKAYAGSGSCAQCHTEGTQSTSMARAASIGSEDSFLKQTGPLTLQSEKFKYQVKASASAIDYSVSGNGHVLSQKLAWVIGAGDYGRTFLYQADDHWQQSEVSFYTRPASLDVTTGLGQSTGTSLLAALGQPLSSQEAKSCFGCHTVHATTSAGLEPLHAEPGVGCEACHGPARVHVDRMAEQGIGAKAGDAEQAAIFDPAKLSPEDSIDFCGSCHRSSADAKLSVTQDFRLSVIRFQPYRLEESKCWRATKDERLTCVACHNPHKPLDRDPVSYDRQCLKCHAGSTSSPVPLHAGLVCPKAKSNCVTCHMPRIAVPSMHGEFSDHDIRIARAGEQIPR
jgi:hypothetical protein